MASTTLPWTDRRDIFPSRSTAYFPEVQSAQFPHDYPCRFIQPKSSIDAQVWTIPRERREPQSLVVVTHIPRAEFYDPSPASEKLIRAFSGLFHCEQGKQAKATDFRLDLARHNLAMQSRVKQECVLQTFTWGAHWNDLAREDCSQIGFPFSPTYKAKDPLWLRDPESILARLETPADFPEDLSQAVLFAEITPFTDAQRPRLLTALGEFITENRFTQDDKTITHVASAIRKYAMNMDEENFEDYAEWFELAETKSLACDIKLELAKGVVSRILYEPFATNTETPRLTEKLVGLASNYMKPPLILKKSYDAVVLNATIAAILLDAPNASMLIEAVKKLDMPWFEQLLFRRLEGNAKRIPADQAELKRRMTQWLPSRE